MSEPDELKSSLDRAAFFHFGRALCIGVGSSLLGEVTFTVKDRTLRIESFWGGGEIPCTGWGGISAKVRARAFCSLIKTRRDKTVSGTMEIVFRPTLKEFAIERRGIKAKFNAEQDS